MENSFNPKVTIVIPVYNGEMYVREAINSALNQTYKNIEIIVVNDGSIDGTEKIVKEYKDKVVYVNKKNGGVSSALNEAIRIMSGDYFSWLSHDDVYFPEKIEKEVTALASLKNKNTIIMCNVDVVSPTLKLIKHNKIEKGAIHYMECFLSLNQDVGLNGCSLLINKELFNKYGLFDEKLFFTQDYDMWLRFAEREEFYLVEEPLVKSRQHQGQVSQKNKEVPFEVDKFHSENIRKINLDKFESYFGKNISQCEKLYIKLLKELKYPQSAVELLINYVKILIKRNEKEKAMQYVYNQVTNNGKLKYDIRILDNVATQKRKILFYTELWVKGGIERLLVNLFKFFEEEYEIILVCGKFDRINGYKLSEKIEVIEIGQKISRNISNILLFICKFKKIDIFIGMQNLNDNFIKTYKLLNESGIKTIASNNYNYYFPFENEWLYKFAYIRNNYYKYVDLSIWSTMASLKAYSIFNTNGVYLGNPNTFGIGKEKVEFNNNLVAVGRFNEPGKRLDLTLSAFNKILREVPNAKLTIVGPYNLKMKVPNNAKYNIEELINKLKIPKEKISFEGQCNNVEKYYEKADLFLLTSESEGFGMVINEAACFGVPTISYNISGIDDIILNGQNGYLVSDEDEFVKKAVSYLKNNNLKKQMSDSSLQLVKRFETQKIVLQWKKLIDDVINNTFVKQSILEDEYEKRKLQNKEKALLSKILEKNKEYDLDDIQDNKGSYFNQVKYYLKAYGLIATIKKILRKILK